MAFVTDSFTGTAGTSLQAHTGELGATWTERPDEAGVDAVLTAAGLVRSANAANTGVSYYASGTPAGVEYDVQADLYVASNSLNCLMGITGRVSTSAKNWYEAQYYQGSGSWRLLRWLNGSVSVTASYVQALTAGQTYQVKLQLRDATKKVFVDGVERISISTNEVTAAGLAGIRGGGATSDAVGYHLDNFSAVDAGAPAAFAVTGNLGLAAPAASGSVVLAWPVAGTLSLASPAASGAVGLANAYPATGALSIPTPAVAGSVVLTWPVGGSLSVATPAVSGSVALANAYPLTGSLSLPTPAASGSVALAWPVGGGLALDSPGVAGSVGLANLHPLTGALSILTPAVAGSVTVSGAFPLAGDLSLPAPAVAGSVTAVGTFPGDGDLGLAAPAVAGSIGLANAYPLAGDLSLPAPAVGAAVDLVTPLFLGGGLALQSPGVAGAVSWMPAGAVPVPTLLAAAADLASAIDPTRTAVYNA